MNEPPLVTGHQLADNAAIARLASAGATALTHLGNGCPSQMHRHCNPIWAGRSTTHTHCLLRVLTKFTELMLRPVMMQGLAEDRLSAMFIPDGLHIPFHVLRVMLRAKTLQRSIFVSDLAPAALLPPGVHECFGTVRAIHNTTRQWSGWASAYPGCVVLCGVSCMACACTRNPTPTPPSCKTKRKKPSLGSTCKSVQTSPSVKWAQITWQGPVCHCPKPFVAHWTRGL